MEEDHYTIWERIFQLVWIIFICAIGAVLAFMMGSGEW